MVIAAYLTVSSVLLISVAAAVLWKPEIAVEELKARWAPAPSRFIAMDGMQVHMRDEGLRTDPTPIVLLHGTASSLHTWEGWVQRLKMDYRLISYDLPGSGLTGPNSTGDYTAEYQVEFLRRFLDEMNLQRVILAGNSSGGHVAWLFAAKYPDRVARLVLLDAVGYPFQGSPPIGLRLLMQPVISRFVLRFLPRSAIAKSVRGTYGDPSKVTPELIDRTYQLLLRKGNRRALGESLRQGKIDEQSALIRQIKAPTLIFWGERDRIVPRGDAQRFHSDIAGSRLVMAPGVGHVPQEESPANTADELQRFLSNAH